MILHSTHRTLYRYRSPAFDSHTEVRLMPLTDSSQVCRAFQLSISPPSKIYTYEDTGGTVHHFTNRSAHQQLEIVAYAEVETLLSDPFQGLNMLDDDWAYYDTKAVANRYPEFLAPSPYVSIHPDAVKLASDVREKSKGSVAIFLLDLSHRMFETFTYDPDATHVHSTVEDVLAQRAGVCQDFTHVMLACCRSQGIPARYVSGYLYSHVDHELRGNEAMHAWVECAMPDGRWLAVDPTNNLLANDSYVRVHVGRDYGEVAPTRGIYVGTPAEELEVTLKVVAVSERDAVAH